MIQGHRGRRRRRRRARGVDLDRIMMKRALDLARSAAEQGEVPVGAVVHRNGEIIAEAANTRENDAVRWDMRSYWHFSQRAGFLVVGD